jgi:hypothetical protein
LLEKPLSQGERHCGQVILPAPPSRPLPPEVGSERRVGALVGCRLAREPGPGWGRGLQETLAKGRGEEQADGANVDCAT